jgi:quinol monooxygenase YgiN
MSADLHIFVRFDSAPEHEAELARAIAWMLPQTRAEPGCLEIHVYRASNTPARIYVHSRWRDEAAFELHARLPHMVEFLERVRGLISHELDVTRTRQVD